MTKGDAVVNDKLKDEKPKSIKRSLLRNLVILVAVAGLLAILYFTSDRFRMHAQFVITVLSHGDMAGLKDYLLAWGAWAPVISAAIMILQSVVAPLPAFIVTVTNGWLFGTLWGTLLSWSSAMAGAALCFYIARGFGRPAAEKFVSKKALNFVDKFFERYGTNSVLIARLIPVVSFDAVSYAAGLTPIKFWGFFVATGIGQLPATIVYSWLGQNLSLSAKIGLWAVGGVAALLILGLTVKKAMERRIHASSS
ncbi:MAG: TVP38/TMEM64 family protein [Dehalococcoidales bacterium]|nr:TVP38/TMEM64 family protein [Dehalococcoidales bacterium]